MGIKKKRKGRQEAEIPIILAFEAASALWALGPFSGLVPLNP